MDPEHLLNGFELGCLDEFENSLGAPPWYLPDEDELTVTQIGDRLQRKEFAFTHPEYPSIQDTTIRWEYSGTTGSIDRTIEERNKNGEIRGQAEYIAAPYLNHMATGNIFSVAQRYQKHEGLLSSEYIRLSAGSGFERQMVSAYIDKNGDLRSVGVALNSVGVATRKLNRIQDQLNKIPDASKDPDALQQLGDQILEDLDEHDHERSVDYLHLFFTDKGIKIKQYTDINMRFDCELTMDEEEEDFWGYFEPAQNADEEQSELETEIDNMKALEGDTYDAGLFELRIGRKGDMYMIGVFNKAIQEWDLGLTLPAKVAADAMGTYLSGHHNTAKPKLAPYLQLYIKQPPLGRELKLAA